MYLTKLPKIKLPSLRGLKQGQEAIPHHFYRYNVTNVTQFSDVIVSLFVIVV